MWERLLQPEYLFEPAPGQPGPFRILYLLLAIASVGGLGLAIALARKARAPSAPRTGVLGRQAVAVETALCALALALIGSSFAGIPYLSMRILVFGSSVAAWVYPVAAAILRREGPDLGRRHQRALTGRMDVAQAPLALGSQLLLVGAHGLGWWLSAQHYRWGPLSALLWVGLLSPQWGLSLYVRRWRVHLEGLAPLFGLYAVLALRLLLLIGAKWALSYPGFALPNPWGTWLNVDVALWATAVWSLAAQAYAVLRHLQRERLLAPALAVAVLLFSFAWASYSYVHLRTHGVTGTDPYGYAQMGVDIAQTGLPVHRFPLVATLQRLGVFPEAGVHLGYHLPFDANGRAATVWPVGQALFLAVGYRLAGEDGLYWTTPVLGLLSLVVLAALGWELLSQHSLGERLLVSAVAVFLLATSYAQMERLVVPMADAAAQLFTTLTVLLALKAVRATRSTPRYVWAWAAGLSFGLAYLVRHTQLVLGASVLLLVMGNGWKADKRIQEVRRAHYPFHHRPSAASGPSVNGGETDKRMMAAQPIRLSALYPLPGLGLLACFAVGALCFGVPDLLYHQWVMGHWLRPESLELRHFSLAFMLPMAWRVLRDLLAAKEFLYVSPFVLYGFLRQWREERPQWAVLSTWAASILLIHLPYEALRLRDLLSLFPVLCLWAGYGVLGVWRALAKRWLWKEASPFLVALAYAWLVLALLLLRTRSTLALSRAPDFDAFGHLNAFQRAGFAQIGRDTEATAYIGATLNSGSVELHSQRTAFRPAVWRSDEFYAFADDALQEGTSLYLLQDGLEMSAPVEWARQRYELELVGFYDIPFYHTGGGSSGGLVPLYRLRFKRRT